MNFQKPAPTLESVLRSSLGATCSPAPAALPPQSEIPAELCTLHAVIENLEIAVKSLVERLDPVLYFTPQEKNIKEDAPPRKTKCGQQIYDAAARIRQLTVHLSTINESLEI